MTLEDVFLKLTAEPEDQVTLEEDPVSLDEKLYGEAPASAPAPAYRQEEEDAYEDEEADEADSDDDYVPLFGGRKNEEEDDDE
jgi:hypothetical protein